MPRKVTRKGLIKQLDCLIDQIIKLRDKSTCQKCGKVVEGSNCHGSHVIPVSAGHKLRWDENNLKVMCYHDHINWWHKNPMESYAWFKEKFPERVKYLSKQKGMAKFYDADLMEMKEKLLKRLEHLQKTTTKRES